MSRTAISVFSGTVLQTITPAFGHFPWTGLCVPDDLTMGTPGCPHEVGNQRPPLGVSTVMRLSVLWLTLLIRVATAAEWGPSVNGLRVSLAVETDTVVVTFENVRENRDMFLPLGRIVGVGRAEFIHLYLILPDGARTQLQYSGGGGGAPGRLLPFIVPMMAGSIYSVRTPLRNWRLGSNLDPIEPELSRGSSLQADILAGDSLQREYVNCYGLQMFWSGRAVSNVVRH